MKPDYERICLRPLSFKELKGNYVSWLNDFEVCKHNGHGEELYTLEMATEYIKSLKEDKTKMVFAVYLLENDCHIGNISIQNIDLKNKSAEIAFLFGEKQYWGKGYATEAAELIIELMKYDLGLHRAYIGTSVYNIGMQKVSEKLGFNKEGVLKDAQFKNGKYNDMILYSKIIN